jgi:hypothetical protein
MNQQRRRIFVTAKGKYLVKTTAGKVQYGAKAAFLNTNNGQRTVNSTTAFIPMAIRPKKLGRRTGGAYVNQAKLFAGPKVRKVRSNKGQKRAAYKPRVRKMLYRIKKLITPPN